MPEETDQTTRSGSLRAGVAAAVGAAIAIGLYLFTRRRPRIDEAALAVALLTPDAALDAEIAAGLSAQTPITEAKWTRALRSALDRYRAAKRAAIAAPGQALGHLIRLGGDGGEGFCKRIGYCKRKHRLKQQTDLIKEASEERIFGAKEAGEWIKENAPDAWEVAQLAAEEFAELAADGLFIPIVARGVKYGLDDICPCCAPCDGSGRIDEATPCSVCNGTGSRKPFLPLPPN